MKVLLLLFVFLYTTTAICPWEETGLTKWSSVTAWNKVNANVTISASQKVLLDVGSLTLSSLNISGQLIFRNSALNLTTRWILVNNGGKFIMGSSNSSCWINSRVVITLTGPRTTVSEMKTDPYDQTALGTKGIAIATNATCEIWGRIYGSSWTRLAKNARPGDTQIYVQDTVSWLVGSKIVLATTDFSAVTNYTKINQSSSISWSRGKYFADQTEVLTVKYANATAKWIKLAEPIKYLHWGSDYERAEVGVLSRHITIQGDADSDNTKFGAQFIIRRAASVHIRGVEFTRVGQKGVMGRYPIHFHFMKNVIGKGFYARDNSIHNSYQRCVVIHASDGILIKDNVAYNNGGQCYFLEDGAETYNTFDHNLGINALPIADEDPLQIIPTDSSPSTFWITNPNNTFTNNAAVGARFGYWFVMPDKATGLSRAGLANDPWIRPRCTPLLAFTNNVAHSNVEDGIFLDDFLASDGKSESGVYAPKQGPFDPALPCTYQLLPTVEPVFSSNIVYKNRKFGIWGRTSMRWTNTTLLDNQRGFMVLGQSILDNSIIVGESANIGTPRLGHTRSFSDLWGNNNTQIQGFESYDNGGPQYSKNNRFYNFTSTPARRAASVGSLIDGPFQLLTLNKFMNSTFSNANPTWLEYKDNDAQYGWATFDVDGTITGNPSGGWITSNSTNFLTENCTWRADWNAYSCAPFPEGGYVHMGLVDFAGKPNRTDVNGVTRVTPAGAREIFIAWIELGNASRRSEQNGPAADCAKGARACKLYEANLLPRRGYTVRFQINGYQKQTPTYCRLTSRGALPGDFITLAIPYPASGYPFQVNFTGTIPMTEVDSLTKLDTKTYFWDRTTEHLYVIFKNTNDGQSPDPQWGFETHWQPNWFVDIKASCSYCVPTKLALPKAWKIAEEQQFRADLQPCQVVSTKVPTSGAGKAFFYFYPSTLSFHYIIYHGLAESVTRVGLYDGAYGVNGKPLTYRNITALASPLRGVFTLTKGQWDSLVVGNLSVQVFTKSYPAVGQLRGQIRCYGTCTVSPSYNFSSICSPPYTTLDLFNSTVVAPWNDVSQLEDGGLLQWNNTDQKICGKITSYKAMVRAGSILFSSGQGVSIDPTKYSHFEFYAKAETEDVFLTVTLKNSGLIQSLDIGISYVDQFIINSDTWARVRIPLQDLNIVSTTTVNKVMISNSNKGGFSTFYVNQIRFIGNVSGTETTYTTVLPSQIKYYDPKICEHNGL